MPVQTTYSERMDVGRPGLVVGSDFNVDTGIVEDATLGFGLPCHQGSVSDQGIKLAGTLATFRGVTVRDVTQDQDNYPQYKNAGVLVRGQIWVTASVAVTPTDPVHYDGTTGAWLITGQQGPILGARWKTSAGIGELALVELSGYNQ